MKRAFAFLLLGLTALTSLALAEAPRAAEQIALPGAGHLGVFRPSGEVDSVAVLLSGRGGWGPNETAIAAQLTANNTLVLGLDLAAYEKSLGHGASCAFLAGSLQDVTRAAEKQLQLPGFIEPMLVGYAEGASYAYGAIGEAPQNTFKGGVGFAYDPATVLPRPLCKGAGGLPSQAATHGFTLGTAQSLSAPFTVLQGERDPVTAAAVQASFGKLEGARAVEVKNAAQTFTDPALFKDQLIDEYWQIAGTDSAFKAATDTQNSDLSSLPITEIRDSGTPEGNTFAIFYSGDGGWADLDSGVSAELAKRGIPVVGISSLKYFWQARTPDAVGADLNRVARHYLAAWHKKDFIVVGYSFGADIAPFAANRLDPATRHALRGMALIGASRAASFEFHVSDWLTDSNTGTPTGPEVDRLAPLPVVCIHGQGEDASLCPDLKGKGAINVQLEGGHHLDGAYPTIADSIARVPEG